MTLAEITKLLAYEMKKEFEPVSDWDSEHLRKKGMGMKRVVPILLSIAVAFFASGCSESRAEENTSVNDSFVENTLQVNTGEMEEISKDTISDPEVHSNERFLIAYFSRVGNTQYPEGMDASTSASIVIDEDIYGATEYVAYKIQEYVGGDLHLIQTQKPYPTDFDEVIEINHEEMDKELLPPLVESNLDIREYDTIFIGYPVWATDVPQAVLSFLDEYDLTGKTVALFCTHDGYGAGRSYDTIRETSHGTVLPEGLAIESKDILSAESTIIQWLSSTGIAAPKDGEMEKSERAIKITIGDIELDGVLYDTALAQEILDQFPLTISMSSYGGREYYGSVDFYPNHLEGGQKSFENGHITYCEAHHNMAIFYAQTDHPTLSVDVIPIGKVTSDLSIFAALGNREEITFSLK